MTEDERKRRDAVQLFTIQVQYEYEKETKLHKMRNMLGSELQRVRETLFSCGLSVEMNTGHWVIISPFSLGKIEIFLQKKYFE